MPAPGPSSRRRPRRGSIERPVSGRVYRGTWLLVGVPLLVAAFSVTRPPALAAPSLPPAFDEGAARAAATQLANTYPDRTPGTAGARAAAAWYVRQLKAFGLPVEVDAFDANIVGLGRRWLENVAAVVAGQSPDTIVVMAHRDDTGEGQGANDNASGTAALIELARAYAAPADVGTAGATPVAAAHRIVFLSTDGGSFGAAGVEGFLARSPYRKDVVAVVNLDAIGGRATPRLELAGSYPRSPAGTLVRTAAVRLEEETGSAPRRPSGLAQLIDLAFPFSLYEQAPFVGRGIPAITITTGGSHPGDAFGDRPSRLSTQRLGAVGRATQNLLGSLDGGLELARGTTGYIWLGERVLRGWAVELVLIAALAPFLVASVDLFARCRRRHVRLRPAFAAYRSRALFWLFVGGVFELLRLAGVWPTGADRPIAPHVAAAHDLPVAGLIGLGCAALVGWAVARHRLRPRRPITATEELAGNTAALLALACSR